MRRLLPVALAAALLIAHRIPPTFALGQGTFESPPVWNADGTARVQFIGGTVYELDEAAGRAGAQWVEVPDDLGRRWVLNVGFSRDWTSSSFRDAFPDGFQRLTSMVLRRSKVLPASPDPAITPTRPPIIRFSPLFPASERDETAQIARAVIATEESVVFWRNPQLTFELCLTRDEALDAYQRDKGVSRADAEKVLPPDFRGLTETGAESPVTYLWFSQKAPTTEVPAALLIGSRGSRASVIGEATFWVAARYMDWTVTKADNERVPFWLLDGSGKYFGDRAAQLLIGDQLTSPATILRTYGAPDDGALSAYVTVPSGPSAGNSAGYVVGRLAVGRLAQLYGERSLFTFWRSLLTAPNWRAAFRTTFGVEAAQFEADFEAWRATRRAVPTPVVEVVSSTPTTVDGAPGREWEIRVTNWATVPGEIFSGIGPIGFCNNTSVTARTWVDLEVLGVGGRSVTRLCDVTSVGQLQSLRFRTRDGDSSFAFLRILDRAEEIGYVALVRLAPALAITP